MDCFNGRHRLGSCLSYVSLGSAMEPNGRVRSRDTWHAVTEGRRQCVSTASVPRSCAEHAEPANGSDERDDGELRS